MRFIQFTHKKMAIIFFTESLSSLAGSSFSLCVTKFTVFCFCFCFEVKVIYFDVRQPIHTSLHTCEYRIVRFKNCRIDVHVRRSGCVYMRRKFSRFDWKSVYRLRFLLSLNVKLWKKQSSNFMLIWLLSFKNQILNENPKRFLYVRFCSHINRDVTVNATIWTR